jgi:hypothetical protein
MQEISCILRWYWILPSHRCAYMHVQTAGSFSLFYSSKCILYTAGVVRAEHAASFLLDESSDVRFSLLQTNESKSILYYIARQSVYVLLVVVSPFIMIKKIVQCWRNKKSTNCQLPTQEAAAICYPSQSPKRLPEEVH